jgi:hypothetical protein
MAQRILTLLQATPGALAACQPSASSGQSPEVATLAASLADPDAGMRQLALLADENLQHLRQGEPLSGQLLPYLRAADGAAYGLRVEKHRGLLDPLRQVREGIVVPHYNRYI